MKYIINESEMNYMNYDKLSDLLYKLIMVLYPKMYDDVNVRNDSVEFWSEEYGDLLFYYDNDKDFFVGVNFLREIYNVTKIKLFDSETILYGDNNREPFNEFIKVFAKRYYGLNVNGVYFHFY